MKLNTDLFNNLWENSQFSQQSKIYTFASFACLFIVSATSIVTEKFGGKFAQLSILITIIGLLIYNRSYLRSSIIYLLLASILVQLCSWQLSQQAAPELTETSAKVHRLAAWFYMIPIAYLLGGSLKNTLLVWSIAFLSLALSPWLSGHGWAEIVKGLAGSRSDLGLHNAQHTSTFFACSLLAFICFYHRITSNGRRLWRLIIWIAATTICVIGLYISNSRAIWLGLAVSLPLLLLFALTILFKSSNKRPYKISYRHLTMAVVLLSLLVFSNQTIKDGVSKRFKGEKETIVKILNGEHNFTRWDNSSIRFATWLEAHEWITKKPFFGWGGQGRKLVVQNTEQLPNTYKNKNRIRHLHNSYLDTLVNYGFAGLTILLCLAGFLIYAAHYAWRRTTLPTDMLLFTYTFIAFWGVINSFESYMFYSSGKFIFGLIGGGILTLYWKAKYQPTPTD
ncbi:MAG: O-antigen ligase family protein [Amphritea sp.]